MNYSIKANAVLPTGGKAKTWSPLSVRDFMEFSSIVYSTEKGYKSLKNHVQVLAIYEGVTAHANAIKYRDQKKWQVEDSPIKGFKQLSGE